MSVYKPAKSRFYHYDFQYQGRRFHGSTGQEARRAAEEVERRRRRSASLHELDISEIPTLHQAASAWWLERGKHLRTADDVWRRIATNLRLIGKDTLVTEIDQSMIAGAIRKRRQESFTRSKAKDARRHPIAPATVNGDLVTLLRRVLRHAARDSRVKLPVINWGELRLPEPEPYFRLYTPAQREAWRQECDDVARFALDLLLTYGLRFGELYFPPEAFHPAEGDTEDDVPFLAIEKRKRQMMVLPLRSDDARRIAARVSRAIAAGIPSIWIEQTARGKLVEVGYQALISRLRTAARRAGLTMPMVIHGTRHHAGTMILKRTQNLKAAQQLLGHVSIASTMRYAHVMTRDLKAALELESRNSPEPTAAEEAKAPLKQRRRRR